MVITTPSGYEVTIKERFTYGDNRRLQRELLAGAKFKKVKNTTVLDEVSPTSLYDVQDKMVSILVVKIKKGDKEYTEDLLNEVLSWDVQDADIVYRTVTEISDKLNKEAQIQGEKK